MQAKRSIIKLRGKGAFKDVTSLKPEAKKYEVRTDLKGLLIVVQPSGVKSYIAQWGRGKRNLLSENAHHPVMTPEAAYMRIPAKVTDVSG